MTANHQGNILQHEARLHTPLQTATFYSIHIFIYGATRSKN